MARRSHAREIALQMLYQKDLNPDISVEIIRAMVNGLIKDDALRAFAWSLFAGVMESRTHLDHRIESTAANWALSRMAATDRNALRIGAFELLYTETPASVVIDEAVELARKFGSANSSQFVNGILDRLIPADKQRVNTTIATE